MITKQIGDYFILNEYCKSGLPSNVGESVKLLRKHEGLQYELDVELENGDIVSVKNIELSKPTEEDLQRMTYIKRGNKVIYSPTGELITIEKTDYLHGQVEIKFEKGEMITVGMELLKEVKQEVSEFEYKFNVGDEVIVKTNDRWDGREGLIREYFLYKDKTKGYSVKLSEDEIFSFTEDELKLKDDSEVTQATGYFEQLGTKIGKLVDEKQKAYGDSVTKCFEITKILLKDYKNEQDNTYTIPESLLENLLLEVRKIDKMNRRFSNPDGDLMGENPHQDDVGYSMLGVRMVEHSRHSR